MQLIVMKCPNCGADLNVQENRRSTVCPYCKSTFLVDQGVLNLAFDSKSASNAFKIASASEEKDFLIRGGELLKYNGGNVPTFGDGKRVVYIPSSVKKNKWYSSI